jgi:hypothetical protein
VLGKWGVWDSGRGIWFLLLVKEKEEEEEDGWMHALC